MTKPHLSNPRVRSEIRAKTASVERAERVAERQARHVLSDVERAERRTTGGELQRQITDLAELLGWEWMEVGPLRTQFGWRTPTRGTLGEGWPDLTLVRQRDYRIVFVEIKRELEWPRPEQLRVLDVLAAVGDGIHAVSDAPLRRVEVYVWRPSDLRDPVEASTIYQVLR